MRPLRASLAAVTAAVALAAAPASAQFTNIFYFGDSLTDPGNLFARIGIPGAPYFEGRTSNGRVWAEYVADDFAARGLPTGNFAYAFGNAVENDDMPELPIQVPDLPDQIADFAATGASQIGERPVAALWFGSNDIFDAIRDEPTPQHVGAVAHRVDPPGAEIDLKGGHAEGRADRGTDFGGEVREGLQSVAGQRGRHGELRAGELDAVAAVTGKAHDGRLDLFAMGASPETSSITAASRNVGSSAVRPR